MEESDFVADLICRKQNTTTAITARTTTTPDGPQPEDPAWYLMATQLVQTVEPVAAEINTTVTPVRIEVQPTQPQTTILRYRVTTGSMNISSLFCLLL